MKGARMIGGHNGGSSGYHEGPKERGLAVDGWGRSHLLPGGVGPMTLLFRVFKPFVRTPSSTLPKCPTAIRAGEVVGGERGSRQPRSRVVELAGFVKDT